VRKHYCALKVDKFAVSMTVAPARLAPNTNPLFSNGLCT
jgi:hypothetical protein